MQGKKKQELLDEGLEILASHGPDGLTIDALCAQRACTKGSFYHHFESRERFVCDLLEFWIEKHTLSVITKNEQEQTPKERQELILHYAWAVPQRLDASIRAWALRDPLIESFVRRADAIRLEYLQDLFRPFVQGEDEARLMARLRYSLYLGARFICPPLLESEIYELAVAVSNAFGLPVPGK